MDLKEIKGISEKREQQFHKLGIYTVEDLVRYYPRDYCDLTNVVPLRGRYHGDVVLTRGQVLNVTVNRFGRRPFVKALCQQGESMFTAVWFNQMYVSTKLRPGEYLFYGRVQNRMGLAPSLVNPTFEEVQNNVNLKGIVPVYGLTEGLTQKIVRTSIRQALGKVPLKSVIPERIAEREKLMPLEKAYLDVHCPTDMASVKRASERIALEEYFVLISAFRFIKGDDNARTIAYPVSRADVQAFVSRFPFSFTNGQMQAVGDIFSDLTSSHRMNRLLQGDVGSGKTAVALAAIYLAVKAGHQVAMLAPTEVLASQNAALIQKYIPECEVAFLAGTTVAAEKRYIKKGLKNGTIPIVCGTHAILQNDVEFADLSLVVCDEQHRFGVAQRSALAEKGQDCDVLVMSATPIPRTLSLICYGDLSISTILDKPAARQEVSTSIIPQSKVEDMYRYCQDEALKGNQSYFVCPKIEGDDEGTITSVTELFEELKQKMPRCHIGLLHGKMRDKEKERVMSDFKNKVYDCLVSTTVIEVGVDVPSATIMVIYNAERFGLAQLHQLRGRVGRGSEKSYCFLLSGLDTATARERLLVLKNNTDGFKIAEMDLEMRGSGDFMGTRQSGRVLSELGNLKFSTQVVYLAKQLSDEAFEGVCDLTRLRIAAMKKYNSLKDVVLN